MLILVGGQKGGTGKSTVATNLAAMRQSKKHDVLLCDIDPQATATLWAARREEEGKQKKIPCVQKVLSEKISNQGLIIKSELEQLLPRYEDIIVDAGGMIGQPLKAALCLADVFIIPLSPSAFDIWTLEALSPLVEEVKVINSKLTARALFNRVPSNYHAEKKVIKEAYDTLESYPALCPLNSYLIERIHVSYAQKEGLSAVEFNSKSKSALEFNKIYNEVFNESA